MSKAILMSIKPKYCEIIASGRKTIEVRKTVPKQLTPPFKVYIYCTKDKWQHFVQMPDKSYRIYDGRDYGKFDQALVFAGEANGKVIGEYVCDEITEIRADNFVALYFNNPANETCLNDFEMRKYANGKNLFLKHISDLVIYDKPKELREFGLLRPFQSWGYVEEV